MHKLNFTHVLFNLLITVKCKIVPMLMFSCYGSLCGFLPGTVMSNLVICLEWSICCYTADASLFNSELCLRVESLHDSSNLTSIGNRCLTLLLNNLLPPCGSGTLTIVAQT